MKNISDLFSIAKGDINSLKICANELEITKDILLKKEKYTITVLALGDVGSNLLLGLYLMGNSVIDKIQIWDIDENVKMRFEAELGQISNENNSFPKVVAINEESLFDCDIFLFCASSSIPQKITKDVDVRMIQLEKNQNILKNYCDLALKVNYNNIFAIVSDPVDPLCKFAEKSGIQKEQIKGFGLGVMMARSRYYAKIEDLDMSTYLKEARAFGPHGKDLVIANSIKNYDNTISSKITKLTIEANLKIRDLGFKPYIAPAISSGALSLISYLKGEWNYSSVPFGNIFLGIRNKRSRNKVLVENYEFDDILYSKIESAIVNLQNINY